MTIAVMGKKAGRGLRAGMSAVLLLALCAPEAACADDLQAGVDGIEALHPSRGPLRARLEALQKMDMQVQPERTRAAIDALLAEAKTARHPPIALVFLARKSRAATFAFGGDPNRALRELDALLADLGTSPLAGGAIEVEVKANRAALLGLMGRVDEAEAVFRQILPYQERTHGPDSEDALAVKAELAVIRYRKGDPSGAEQALAEVVRAARAAPEFPPHILVKYWQNWATLLNTVGRTGDSINELQACSQFAETHLGEGHASTLASIRNLGNALSSAGRYGEAEAVLRRVLDLTVKTEGEASPAIAVTYNNLGNALNMQRGADAALPMFKAAYEHAKRHPDVSAPTSTQEYMLNLAVVTSAAGRAQESLGLRRQALEDVEKVAGSEHSVYARASAELGTGLLDAGDAAAALPYLEKADALFARLLPANHNQRLDNAVLLGIARYRAGDSSGYALATQAARLARETLLDQVVSPAQTLKTARRFAGMFTRYAELGLATGHAADAFDAIQLSQLGDLDTAGAALMSRRATLDPGLSELLRRLQDTNNRVTALRQARSKHVGQGQAAQTAAVDRQINEEVAAMTALRAQVERTFPAYARLIRPEPESLASVQARLARDQALLLAVPSASGVLSMLVTAGGIAHAKTPLPAGALATWVGRIRGAIDDAMVAADPAQTAFDSGAASALHAALLPPALDRVASRHRNLAVVAGGALASVPMGLLVTKRLPDDSRLAGDALRKLPWLLRRQAVSTPVSLRLLGTGTASSADQALRFAGIGAPQLAPADNRLAVVEGVSRVLRGGSVDAASLRSLPDLPDADAELARMGAAFGRDALLLTGTGATEAKVRAMDLRPYDVIAFATHGLVSGELRGVSEPGLVLTPVADDPADDGLLTASDVAELRLDADWVILSACNTAAGENPGAPLFSGLARAFVHAGARALLLSHWQVRDDVASRLSVETVQGSRQGEVRAEALRRAQLRLIDDRHVAGAGHPALWAPFALIGN